MESTYAVFCQCVTEHESTLIDSDSKDGVRCVLKELERRAERLQFKFVKVSFIACL